MRVMLKEKKERTCGFSLVFCEDEVTKGEIFHVGSLQNEVRIEMAFMSAEYAAKFEVGKLYTLNLAQSYAEVS